MYVLDPDGLVRLWNPAAESTFGWSEGEVLGRPDPTISRDSSRSGATRGEEAWSFDDSVEREVVRWGKGGREVRVRLSATPFSATEGQAGGLLVMATDSLDRGSGEAVRLERFPREWSARERLLAIVSHDLRNSLATVLLNASAIIEAPDSAGVAPGVRDQLQWIARSAEQMSRLISDLLDVSAIELGRLTIEPARCPVRRIVQDAAEAYRAVAAEQGIGFVWDAEGDLPDVTADAGRLQQVLGNLLGNAIKFTPPNGFIRLHAEAASPDEIRFTVSDTGPGIGPDHLPAIFDLYWQAGQSRRMGAGLGLAIAKAIVEAHGGSIRVDRSSPAGTTFSFTIPVAVDSVTPRPAGSTQT